MNKSANTENTEVTEHTENGVLAKATESVISSAMAVHRALGPGLLESAYATCLAYELQQAGHRVHREKPLPISYRDLNLDFGYRLDLVVDEAIVVEIKSVEALTVLHEAQLLTYLKFSGCRVGLLLNFNTKLLRDGIRRMVL